MTFSEQDEILAVTTDVAQSCGCFTYPVGGGDAAMLLCCKEYRAMAHAFGPLGSHAKIVDFR